VYFRLSALCTSRGDRRGEPGGLAVRFLNQEGKKGGF
jgi:hypothetical protein